MARELMAEKKWNQVSEHWPSSWMDAMGEAMFQCSGTTITHANSLGRLTLGLKKKFKPFDFLSSKRLLWTKADRAFFDLRWAGLKSSQPGHFRIELDVTHTDGQVFHAKLRFSRAPDDTVLLQITDITEQRFRQSALLEREAHYRKLTTLAQEGIATVKDGVITDANARFISLVGVQRPDEIIGDTIESLQFKKLGNLAPYPGSGVVERAEMHFKNRLGQGLHMDVGKGQLDNGSEVWMLYDITDNKATQFDLIQARERFKLLIESAPIGIVIQQDDGIRFANPAAEELLILDDSGVEDIEGCDLANLVDDQSTEAVRERTALTREGNTPSELQVEIGRPGDKRLVNLAWRLSIYNGSPAVQISLVDVTAQSELLSERVRAQVAEESNLQLVEEVVRHERTQTKLQETGARLKSIFESGDDLFIWTLLSDGAVTASNHNFNSWLQTAGANNKSVTWDELLTLASKSNGFDVADRFVRACLGHPQRFELCLKKSGSSQWLQVFLNPISSAEPDSKKQAEISCIAYDITERKRIDRQIRGTLKEKEILLQEVHHRVKNNLQIISSILSLQKGFLDDSQSKEALTEIQGRVNTMSIIHETLYRHTDVSNISFPEYITRISTNIIQSYSTETRVKLETNLQSALAPLDQAIPCGLIINEWVSNAMKHAFVGRAEGKIIITLSTESTDKESNELVTIAVEDDGVGLSKGFDSSSEDSLGLYLVQALSEQLDAEQGFESGDGTRFWFRFRRDKS
jgi:PAS domain S-box-containing protein